MDTLHPSLAHLSPKEIADLKTYVETWRIAGSELEKLRREELRRVDPQKAIRLLCGPADYRVGPHAPKPSTGLVEQQYWFVKARARD